MVGSSGTSRRRHRGVSPEVDAPMFPHRSGATSAGSEEGARATPESKVTPCLLIADSRFAIGLGFHIPFYVAMIAIRGS